MGFSTNTVAVATLFESTRYKFLLQRLQDVYITGVLAKKNYNLILFIDDTDVFHVPWCHAKAFQMFLTAYGMHRGIYRDPQGTLASYISKSV